MPRAWWHSNFAVAATLTAGSFSWENAAKDFTWMSVGGLGLGASMGWGFSRGRDMVTRRVGDVAATQMVLLLILLPFASYIMGEYIGVSGYFVRRSCGYSYQFCRSGPQQLHLGAPADRRHLEHGRGRF